MLGIYNVGIYNERNIKWAAIFMPTFLLENEKVGVKKKNSKCKLISSIDFPVLLSF